jgi:hypothetical protein
MSQSIFDPKDLPAWLQAIAAIVALAISVWAVLRANAVERRRDNIRAHGIAVAIYPEILRIPVEVENVFTRLADLRANYGHLVGQSIAVNFQMAQITLPSMLERNVDNLYYLGEPAGPACLKKGKTSGEDYVSLSLADPAFGPKKLYANLGRAAGQDDENVFAVIWNPVE